MAHLDVKATYQFQLDADEFRLVVKALSGTMTPAERVTARELNLRFQTIRAKNAQLTAEACQRALQDAKASCTTGDNHDGRDANGEVARGVSDQTD